MPLSIGNEKQGPSRYPVFSLLASVIRKFFYGNSDGM